MVMPMNIERLAALGKTFLRGDWISSAAHQDRRTRNSTSSKDFRFVMFGRSRAKAMGPPPSKKRKLFSTIEEIAFDPSAREDYLTGFHKRKLQRIKHAKEEAAKREREEKLTARKIVSFAAYFGKYVTKWIVV